MNSPNPRNLLACLAIALCLTVPLPAIAQDSTEPENSAGHDSTNHEDMNHEGHNHGATLEAAEVPAELAGESIYQVGGHWQDQDANDVALTELLGKTQVVSMIYTSCEHVCPMIVSAMKELETNLSESTAAEVEFLLVSFTPDTDTPQVMTEYAERHNLDQERWTLLRGDDGDVRNLAMTLGVRYEVVSDTEVNHSNLISVLDEQGRLIFQGAGSFEDARNLAGQINAR